MKKFLMTTAALAAFCAGPLSLPSASHRDHWSFMASAEANNGNSAKNGNGGIGNGNGNGNSSSARSSETGNASDNGRVNGAGKARDNQDVKGSPSGDDVATHTTSRNSSLHAVLGRINSIGRNVNGIMNSPDPHLSGIRSYILNSVELAKAETIADAAHAAYDAALADYNEAGLSGDPATTLSQLVSAAASADPDTATILYDQIDLADALLSASLELTASEARVAQYSVLASDAALAEALATMSNRDLSSSDISSETLQWSKAILGVGDATGAIDAYMAQ